MLAKVAAPAKLLAKAVAPAKLLAKAVAPAKQAAKQTVTQRVKQGATPIAKPVAKYPVKTASLATREAAEANKKLQFCLMSDHVSSRWGTMSLLTGCAR